VRKRLIDDEGLRAKMRAKGAKSTLGAKWTRSPGVKERAATGREGGKGVPPSLDEVVESGRNMTRLARVGGGGASSIGTTPSGTFCHHKRLAALVFTRWFLSVFRSGCGDTPGVLDLRSRVHCEATRWVSCSVHLGDRLGGVSVSSSLPSRRHVWCQRTHSGYGQLSRWGVLGVLLFLFAFGALRKAPPSRERAGAVLLSWNMGKQQPTGHGMRPLPNWVRPLRHDSGTRRDWRDNPQSLPGNLRNVGMAHSVLWSSLVLVGFWLLGVAPWGDETPAFVELKSRQQTANCA